LCANAVEESTCAVQAKDASHPWAPPHDEEEETLANYTMATVGDEDDDDVSDEVRALSSLTLWVWPHTSQPNVGVVKLPSHSTSLTAVGLVVIQDASDDDDTDEVGAPRVLLSRQTSHGSVNPVKSVDTYHSHTIRADSVGRGCEATVLFR
jgi:hypothetical protein